LREDDESLWIRQARTGDRDAFARLVERYWGRIFRWLQSMGGDAHLAEDVTQEVFIKAWQALPAYSDGFFRAWLFRIARNALIDRRREAALETTTPLPPDVSAAPFEPLDQLATREFQTTIDDACRRLPDTVRTAFLLWVQEEMPYDEIALTLDITEVTARWRVYRARQLLLRQLTSRKDPKES
jgi:RNA polymerase sigma-70 factor (ECF subfamily)